MVAYMNNKLKKVFYYYSIFLTINNREVSEKT